AWADMTAKFHDAAGASGAAVFVHPSHPDYPPTWLTRHYGVLCVGWPGVKSRTFEPGKPIRTSYRIWIHKTASSAEQIAKAYSAYTAATRAKWD
ncbi:MAG: PmoA family protein, partial [Pirellulaceae bacterium]|nr:PmoA family protein [Pirellulaceae bacterium]